ncbi:Relaxase domain-containing protein (plasmid) [Rhodovastum atsumiense]|uniref:Relaxase domain-containing protein n=1 Tax=Rhodovastum atsumiense TaxID=504468 RepID=A0A5M6IMY0_9PROT|nr:MobF family relaxase [Rhodovastum atsumiense]KAA5609602.1 relaxase domain-containing protein [Rhodovastum atsumiense]CAH2606368.1 Relaxase domain-containing protein [Rhodovastum atsumiense]
MTASLKRIGGGGDAVALGAAVAYYEQRNAQPREPEADAAQAMDEYLLAGSAAAAQPRWWSVKGALAPDGAALTPGALRALLEGRGLDGRPLVQAAARNQRVGGWDITFSAPKSVSALWAMATPEVRAALLSDLVAAARAGLQALEARGVFETRRGKGSAVREAAADVAAALFPHVTSRAGDPQLHVHAVLINASLRADGTTGSLDPAQLFPWKTYAGAMFRAELAGRLMDRGLASGEDGQAFRVLGVPGALTALWSKRRAALNGRLDALRAALEASAQDAADAARAPGVRQGPLRDAAAAAPEAPRGETLRKLRAAIVAATRHRKDALPSDGDLERRWREDLRGLGLTPESVWRSVRAAAARHQRPVLDAGDAALAEAMARNAVVSARTLRRLIAEQAQTRGGGAAGADAAYARLIRSGQLIALRPNRRGEEMFSTSATLARERQMLRDVLERRGEGSLIGAGAVAAALAARPTLSAEQRAAVRHIARGDGVTVVEGLAGAGKSFALGAIVAAAWASGARVIGLAPSWVAADVVRADANLPDARALQGFVQGLAAGTIRFGAPPAGQTEPGVQRLGAKVVLIVDEASMAGSQDLAALLAQARAHRAQVVLIGDRRQLPSIEPGAAFQAVADALGVSRLADVRRQRHAPPWQQEATRRFAAGDSVEGLTRYDAKRQVRWARDGAHAVRKVAEAWAHNRQLHPAASRMVLAARNADVHALNREIRARLLAAGELGPDTLTVRTLHAGGRHGQGEARAMELRVGDRVTVGVKLARDGRNVLPNDLATLTAFAAGPDPVLSLRIDRTGRTETLRLSELVPSRRAGQAKRPALPALQHAYARTIYKAQGQTADFTIVHAGDGLDASSAYVALTRHRRDALVVADAGLIARRLAESGLKPTREAVRQAFLRTARTNEAGRNASDYVADRATWLRTGDPHALPETARETRGQALVRTAAEMAAAFGQRFKTLRRIDVPAYLRALRHRLRRPMPRRTAAPHPAAAHQPEPAQKPSPAPPPRAPRPAAQWIKVSEHDARHQLRAALDRAGFDVARLKELPVLDGQRHYAPLKEDRGRQQRGAYRAYYDGVRPAGAIWNFHTGTVTTWKADGERAPLAPADAAALARRQAEAAAARARDDARRAAHGARAAQRLWDTAAPADPAHPYLAAKGLSGAGLRQDRHGRLVIPLYVLDGGALRLVNAQTITADGTKRPQYGARKVGAFHLFGTIDPEGPIGLCEGYATAADFHAAAGLPATVMALDSGTLAPVARALRAAYPRAQLIFGADNDAHLPQRDGVRRMPNIGLEKATAAAAENRPALVVAPPALPARTAADAGTDWNDYRLAEGRPAAQAAACRQIAAQGRIEPRQQAPQITPEPNARRPGPTLTI